MIRKVVLVPLILEYILEKDEEEDDEENVPLNRISQLARATK